MISFSSFFSRALKFYCIHFILIDRSLNTFFSILSPVSSQIIIITFVFIQFSLLKDLFSPLRKPYSKALFYLHQNYSALFCLSIILILTYCIFISTSFFCNIYFLLDFVHHYSLFNQGIFVIFFININSIVL